MAADAQARPIARRALSVEEVLNEMLALIGPIPSKGTRVPTYYFHLRGRTDREIDLDGLDLPTDKDAAAQARKAVKELRKEFSSDDWTDWVLEVVDEDGREVLRLPLG